MEGTVKVFGTEPEHLWHLFTTRGEPNDEGSEANLPVSGLPNPANPRQCSTLEVMMSGLPVETMKPFYKSDTMRTSTDVIAVSTSESSDKAVTYLQATGLGKLMPDATLDGHLFTPCGYSVNGIKDDHYFTVHVTPEPAFSYVSVETCEVDADNFQDTVDMILNMFNPKDAIITFFQVKTCASVPELELATEYTSVCKEELELQRYRISYEHVTMAKCH